LRGGQHRHHNNERGNKTCVSHNRSFRKAQLLYCDARPVDRVGTCHNGRPVEISLVRNRLNRAIEASRERSQRRRQRVAASQTAFEVFLQDVATPITKLVANSLKVENYAFTVFTPSGGLRLASDRGRDDFIEFALDEESDPPQVVGRTSRTRGSRTLTEDRPVKPGSPPEEISEEDVLAFLISALEPWFER
jgi:hypothetical protein